MKISEMSFAQASEVMLRIAAPAANICDDEELTKILKDFLAMQTKPNLVSYGKTIPRLLTYCLKNHKSDTYEIIGALLGMTGKEIEEASFASIVKGLKESYDEVLAGFFTRSRKSEKKDATE